MANTFLTRDEVALELGCPALAAMIKSAATNMRRGSIGTAIVPNCAGRDLMPVAFDMAGVSDVDQWETECLARVAGIEAALRARITS